MDENRLEALEKMLNVIFCSVTRLLKKGEIQRERQKLLYGTCFLYIGYNIKRCCSAIERIDYWNTRSNLDILTIES